MKTFLQDVLIVTKITVDTAAPNAATSLSWDEGDS